MRALGAGSASQNVENNTSYNIYGRIDDNTMRVVRESDERRRLMLD